MPTSRKRTTEAQPSEREPKRRSSRLNTRSPPLAKKNSPLHVRPGDSKRKPTEKRAPACKDDAVPDASKSKQRALSEDIDVDAIPAINDEAPRHDGVWYWLLKAEPETRLENGIDVSFSIDDLRAKTQPEGWDGIRSYAARNNLRKMNVGDQAFFYHSNCKKPGIVGIMEIVKEFSEDRSARRPGSAYYDASSTKETPRWSLVHVEFRKKFAVPIFLDELRELGLPGKPLENMQLLRQSRLSVSRVQTEEWELLCKLADAKAYEAGLAHEQGPP